jgi:hypothetical protein
VTRLPELEQELVAAAGRLQSPRRVLRPAVRAALAAAAVAVVIALVAVEATEMDDGGQGGNKAGAPSSGRAKVGIDVQAGVRFRLEGRELTVSLISYAPFETRQRVSSARIRATCGVAFAQVGPEGDPRNERVERTRFWPAGRRSLRFRFSRDISSIARWCRVEDPVVGHVAFIRFATAPDGPLSPEQRIEFSANEWARLFAASDPAACERYMVQPACERLDCMRVGNRPVENCRPPSRAFRQSFRGARVEEIAIERKFAGVRFSNGRTIELIHVEGSEPDGVWLIERFRGDPGRRYFEN